MDDEGGISVLHFAAAVLCTHWDEILAVLDASPSDLPEIRCRIEEIGEGKVRLRITPGDMDRARRMIEG